MKLPETPPPVTFSQAMFKMLEDPACNAILIKALNEYYPWEKVKYLALPEGYTALDLWGAMQTQKSPTAIHITMGKYRLRICPTAYIQKELHKFDMHYGAGIASSEPFNQPDNRQYLISSIMEEAIASSQIEGAITSRKVAKEMLRQNRPPKNKSERMIMNNYITIQRIREMIHEPLTEERLLELQRLMTRGTLDDKKDEGRFRADNDVRVIDSADGEVMYQPPSVSELNELMEGIYKFFNEDTDGQFINPVLKACALHFLIGFVHPFVDGNGRTARAIFYWYMIKKGYWLTEYLSISGIILKTKTAYAKAYLYTETDSLDMTYFLHYKTGVIKSAYENLMKYLQFKSDEKKKAALFMHQDGINERQAQVLQWLKEDATKVISVKEVEVALQIANETARKDLKALVALGLLESRKINKQKEVFVRGREFKN